MQEQDGAAVAIGKQRLQGLGVAPDRGIADDIDRVAPRPCGGQDGIESGSKAGAQFPQRDTGQGCSVSRHHAGAATVGHQGQRVVAVAAEAGQGLGRDEQVLQGIDAQHSGAANGGIEHQV